MQATLFSDASYDHHTKAAGWGAWCKTDDMQFGQTFGGGFTRVIPNASVAELCGIHNALRYALQNYLIVETHNVMIQCDSTDALTLIYSYVPAVGISPHPHVKRVPIIRSRRRMLDIEQEAIDRIKKLVSTFELRLVLRHVKGHKKGDGRNWVNRECDKIAKRHMNEAREALKAQKAVADAKHPV